MPRNAFSPKFFVNPGMKFTKKENKFPNPSVPMRVLYFAIYKIRKFFVAPDFIYSFNAFYLTAQSQKRCFAGLV